MAQFSAELTTIFFFNLNSYTIQNKMPRINKKIYIYLTENLSKTAQERDVSNDTYPKNLMCLK